VAITEIVVREFRPEDEERVVEVFSGAFPEKMMHLVSVPEEKWVDLLLDSGALRLRPFPGLLVAEVDGIVQGSMALDWRGQKIERGPRRSRRGRSRMLDRMKVRLGQWIITRRAKTGEGYVMWICVAPEAQGKGVGTALMDRVEAIAKDRGLHWISLYVAATNEGAKRFYQRRGMFQIGTIRSWTTAWLFGIREWHRMALGNTGGPWDTEWS
jgi:ribosomal protein S18 acetylase RimI-like enzyme